VTEAASVLRFGPTPHRTLLDQRDIVLVARAIAPAVLTVAIDRGAVQFFERQGRAGGAGRSAALRASGSSISGDRRINGRYPHARRLPLGLESRACN